MVKGLFAPLAFLKKRRSQAFTLSEVLVGTALFCLAVLALTAALRHGRRLVLEPENKAAIFSQAQAMLEQYLSKSYDELQHDIDVPPVAVPPCQARVRQTAMPALNNNHSAIPYKAISVVCGYTDEGGAKTMQLSGVVPYPYLELVSAPAGAVQSHAVPCLGRVAADPSDAVCNDFPNATNAGDEVLWSMDFLPLVKSDYLVFYNISLDVPNDSNGLNDPPYEENDKLEEADIVLTQARLRHVRSNGTIAVGQRGAPVSFVTRTGTPLMSQRLINNVIQIPASMVVTQSEAAAGALKMNRLFIVWRRDRNRGDIQLKRVDVKLLRMENNL